MSLRARVLAGAAVIALVLALTSVVIGRVTEAHLLDQVDEQLARAHRPARAFDWDGGPPFAAPGAQPPVGQPSEFYVAIVTEAGRVETLFEPNVGTGGALPVVDTNRAAEAAATGSPYTVAAEGSDARYRLLAMPAGRSDHTLIVGLALDDVDNAVGRLARVELAATAAILAVVGLVSWWVLHLGVRPVKAMTAAAGAIAAGDLSDRVPESAARTEAGALSIALNQMLGRIQSAFDARRRSEDQLRRFVADASHELRTPVTTIRGYAELFRTGGLEDPDALAAAMRRTEQEAVRMGSLVDDLLHLARVDLARVDQGRPLARDVVDLAVVVADAVRDAGAVDPDRPLRADTVDTAIVVGDEPRLRQVVANVVANALVHTPPGTPVSVRLRRADGRAVIEVADEGPGMSAEAAERAFERFYRAEPSRPRHRGGTGLGLAIVAATVAAHDGSVSLRSAPGAGTTVRIELPLSEPA